MPYDNPYNRKIAREVEGLNKSYIKNIGTYFPLEGGSLDTGYDSERIVGGSMEEYVRNVLSGSLNIPTQAMPSSSMSGMGRSGGMKRYKKGMGMSAGAMKLQTHKKGMGMSAGAMCESETEMNGNGFTGGLKKLTKEKRLAQKQQKEKPLAQKQQKEKPLAQKQQKEKKSNPWIDFVKMFASENNISYRDALRHPNIKSEYSRMDKPSAIQKRIAQYEGVGRSGGKKKMKK